MDGLVRGMSYWRVFWFGVVMGALAVQLVNFGVAYATGAGVQQ